MTEFLGDTTCRVGQSVASDINDCNSYVRRLLAGTGLEIPKPLSNILAASDRWQGVQQELRVSIKYVGYLADGDPKPQVVKLHLEERCKRKSNMKREAYSLALAALVAVLLVGIIVSLGLPSLFVDVNQPVIQRGMFWRRLVY